MFHPLAKVLLEAARASEEKEKKLRKEMEGVKTLKKRGIKKQIKDEEERRAKLMRWGISCQRVEHWMREPVQEKGKQDFSPPLPRPTVSPAAYALPLYSENYPTLVVMDGSMENRDGTVVRLKSETINCDYELTQRARPLNKTSPTTSNSDLKNATLGMATKGGPEEASVESEGGEELVHFKELPTPGQTEGEDRGRSAACEEEESLEEFKCRIQSARKMEYTWCDPGP